MTPKKRSPEIPVLNPPQFADRATGPLPDPDGFHNTEIGRLFAYHDRTKHTYLSVRTVPHFLDWDNQPNPFRVFSGAATVPLPVPVSLPAPLFSTLRGAVSLQGTPAPWSPSRLSALLFHSLAISAWKRVRGTDFRYSLRVNPSSGNLHPTEAHLALRGTEGLPAGLYHYRAMDHVLECRRQGSALETLAVLLGQPAVAQAELALVLSSIFWRESWKYRDRAYRYCLHDMGHAMASVALAARGLGAHVRVLGHFSDLPLAEFLGVTLQDEGPLLVIVLNGPRPEPARTGQSGASWRDLVGPLQGKPNVLSTEEVPYHLLVGMHQSTLLPDPPGLVPASLAPAPDLLQREQQLMPLASALTSEPPLDRIVRRRRSALDFDSTPRLSLGDLGTILFHATRALSADFLPPPAPLSPTRHSLITLYLYVNRVTGLEPGVYRYRPDRHQLVLLKQGDVAGRAAFLSLEQELGAHACVTFSMVADLERAAASFGNRGYRYAHIEAGFIGHGLYLGAEGTGWNATGIGAFYDDDVHQFLELKPEQGQVIYHFAIGRAVHDDRILSS